MSRHQRNFGLDVIRTVAIALVLIAHSITIFYPYMVGFAEVLFNFGIWVAGAYGVELFFILSGFLIGGIFIRDEIYRRDLQPQAGLSSDTKSVFTFYLRRLIRTIPNYILYFFLFYAADIYFKKGNFLHSFPLKNFFLVQNFYHNDGRGFMGVAWSLSVEEFFYLFLPVLYILLRLLRFARMRSFIYTASVLWLIPNLLKLYYTLFVASAEGFINTRISHTTMFRMDSIAYGVFLAIIYQCDFAKQIKVELQKRRVALFIAGLLVTLVGLMYNFLFVVKPVQQAYLIYWSYSIRSVGFVLLFPFFIGFREVRSNFFTHTVSYTALWSYSIYLSHVLVIESFHDMKIQYQWNLSAWLQFVVVWMITFIISGVTYYGLERPILKIRDNLTTK